MVERRGRVRNLTKRAPSSYDNSPLSPSFGNQAEYRRSVWWATGLTSETSMLRFLLCSSSFDVCFMLCFARMDFDFVRRRKSLARVSFEFWNSANLKTHDLKSWQQCSEAQIALDRITSTAVYAAPAVRTWNTHDLKSWQLGIRIAVSRPYNKYCSLRWEQNRSRKEFDPGSFLH